MTFRASFCDPFQSEIIEIGDIEKIQIMETFENIPWGQLIEKMEPAKDTIYYSPSLEIENKMNKNGVTVTAIDEEEWWIFFKRPIQKMKYFKFRKYIYKDYVSEITEQNISDVRECLNALINNDLEFLEEKIK